MNAFDVQKEGYLRRLKTQKRRYFVLRTISVRGKPRLEYYESEKKFRTNCPPKRVIQIASCFNITQKEDTKHDFVFALYTRDDVFGLICESKEELNSWLTALLNEQSTTSTTHGIQSNEYLSDSLPGDFQLQASRRDRVPSLPHVPFWHVTVKPRGLGTSKNLVGEYNLKLADHTLCLHKVSSDEVVAEFPLSTVRRCGHTSCFFYIEVGRSSMTGAGEIWMLVEDALLAKNLHEVVLMSMNSRSSDGHSLSRQRCHSGGHKPRPTSLLLVTPPRNRSDTFPDPEAASPDQEGPPSPPKAQTPDHSSPSGGKRGAMFQRLWSVGKRKSEVFDFSPKLFSRRTQSKSLSIDPCPGGLLGRAQSVDFSSLFGALPSSPEAPEERDIDFDLDEPQRTSSNSSGSSERSWEQPLLKNHPYMNYEIDPKSSSPSSRPTEVSLADEGYDSTARDDNTPDESPSLDDSRVSDDDTGDDKTLKRESDDDKDDKQQVTDLSNLVEDKSTEDSEKPTGISQRNRSGYEDMSGNISSSNILEKPENDYVKVRQDLNTNLFESESSPSKNSPSIQRRTSAPPRSDSPILEQLQFQTKSSPKQRRTSEPMAAISNDFLELVTIKNSPSSPRKPSRKGKLGNETISEDPAPSSEDNSPIQSPQRRRRGKDNDEYVDMNPFAKYHTYVNINPQEGFQLEEESAYMNLRPGDYHGTQTENKEHDYMNFKPRESAPEEPVEEEASYVNFQPGKGKRSASSPRQRHKHTYENLHLNGSPKAEAESAQVNDYMNFFPRRHSEKSHGKHKTLPQRKPLLPGRHCTGRRESEPVGLTGRSDEENGMLFLDFSGSKSTESKDLNYISLDLSQKKPSPKGSPRSRPANINTSSNAWSLDIGPKSAPVSTTSYAEIDFTRSHGLRQAIIDHNKPKASKE